MNRINALLAPIAATVATAAASGGNGFSVDWFGIEGGGGSSAGGDYHVSGAAGQPDAGQLSGADYVLVGGFTVEVPAPCAGDADGDGRVNVDDLVLVMTAWNTDDAAADLNQDGTVDVTDLVTVITGWGDCP